MRNYTKGSLIVLGACFYISGVRAQTLPPQQTSAALDTKQLENEATLTVPVSFESQRKPLVQLIGEVSRQTGVALSVADASLRDRLVTARVKALPLSQLMASLAHLYGASWQKGPQGFELHAQAKSPLEVMQLQAAGGHVSFVEHKDYLTNEQDFEGLRRDIVDEWAVKNPEKFNPLALNELSQDVQVRLRYILGQKAITKIIDQYTKATEQLSPESTLLFSRTNNGVASRFKIGLSSASNRYRLFAPLESPLVLKHPQPTPEVTPPLPPQGEP